MRDQIRGAFPAIAFDGQITACNCDECSDIREALRGKAWDEISNEFLDFTRSPVLLTPEAFCAFVPASLMRALDDLLSDNVTLEFTVYSLTGGEEDEEGDWSADVSRLLRGRAGLMSPEQVKTVRVFLTLVAEIAGNAEWFRPLIERALRDVWRD